MKAGALNRYGWILLLCLTGLTQAATLNITAEYNPANYLEEGAKFINTTPCTQSLVNWCSGTATVDKPQAIYVSTYTQRAVKDTEDKRFGIHYLSFPPAREGANKRGNSSRLTQSFHFFMFEPFFLP
ncbi:hypothetical protein [Aeromonas hydrophila]|uniref:hypothetical protein n=1 Tax=Aeromonas hydrophila TaxID=644 RepID=UPI0011C09E5E|nr:hypothetical protein [Aeromonas hydrophila]QEE13588.1 hypothetical protein C1A23_25395 [Aeromonas hydrophila subsp. hydrophila]